MNNCIHGFPSPFNCIDCMEEGGLPQPKWQKIGDPFLAKFTSTCKSCGDPIDEGEDHIRRWDRGDQTVYTHLGCIPLVNPLA